MQVSASRFDGKESHLQSRFGYAGSTIGFLERFCRKIPSDDVLLLNAPANPAVRGFFHSIRFALFGFGTSGLIHL
ncbi:hypothetical protein CEXT_582261 [Caerostris extrusa]|uniref:Uncharacterized protein n=1 Tax=Caerostris extrusa TaxID=172846 RepID=A0AAV4QXG0_CAEEX|nr:hypothetical protein CEXT_582261 [Caerostris extrusa]